MIELSTPSQAWQHPVLVLRDISHLDITAILGIVPLQENARTLKILLAEFVYDGRVDVSQDRLQSFLRLSVTKNQILLCVLVLMGIINLKDGLY